MSPVETALIARHLADYRGADAEFRKILSSVDDPSAGEEAIKQLMDRKARSALAVCDLLVKLQELEEVTGGTHS